MLIRHSYRIATALLAGSLLTVVPAPAIAGKVGAELPVNVTTAEQQMNSSIASYGQGFVVAWQSGLHPEGQYDIYARRYAADGSPLSGEFRVNRFTSGHQIEPKIARLSNHGFVICWASFEQDGSGYGVYCQPYDRRGRRVGKIKRANTNTVQNQFQHSVAALTGGGFVVVWKDEGIGGRIAGQRFANDGSKVGGEFIADADPANVKALPSVAGLSNGGFVVVWQSFEQEGVGKGWGIYGQRYAADGAKAGPEFHVNTDDVFDQEGPQVAVLDGGRFVVAWSGWDSSGRGVKAQLFREAGSKVGGENLINTTTFSHQLQVAVASLRNRGFVILWFAQEGTGPAPATFDINGQAFTSGGAPLGSEFLVNTHSTAADAGPQDRPAVARLGSGFVASWTSFGQDGDREGIYGQRFSAP